MADQLYFHLADNDWETFVERMDAYFAVNDTPSEKRVPELLTKIDADAYELIRRLATPRKPKDFPYDELVRLVSRNVHPNKPSKFSERMKFSRIRQYPYEPVTSYVTRLKNRSLNCKFSDPDTSLRDQFVAGIWDKDTRDDLSKQKDLTFQDAVDLALTREKAASEIEGQGRGRGRGRVNWRGRGRGRGRGFYGTNSNRGAQYSWGWSRSQGQPSGFPGRGLVPDNHEEVIFDDESKFGERVFSKRGGYSGRDKFDDRGEFFEEGKFGERGEYGERGRARFGGGATFGERGEFFERSKFWERRWFFAVRLVASRFCYFIIRLFRRYVMDLLEPSYD